MISRNTQPVEKPFMSKRGEIELHHTFFTIQGEGPFAGDRAVFVRLTGCNLQCPGCDTEYTEQRHRVMPSYVVDQVNAECRKRLISSILVVITGGEPMRQNIARLVFELLQAGHRVQIETNGVLPPSPELALLIRDQDDVDLVVSPKTWKISPWTASLATAFKYVIRAGDVSPVDGLPTKALGHKVPSVRRGVARPPKDWEGVIYVNPMDEQDDARNSKNMAACLRSATVFGYRMGVQLHKILNLE